MSVKTKLPHFRELDGLRGLAALGVFVHHFFRVAGEHPLQSWPRFLTWAMAISSYGAHGVDVFFVLSGFLITCLLLIDRGRTDYFHNFYWKRALRILPVYLVHLTLTEVILGHAWGYIFLGLLFLVNFGGRLHVDPGPAWTLSIWG